MFDPTKPYCRRDGKPARIVHTLKNSDYLVVYDWRNGEKELHYRINKDGYYRDNGLCGDSEHEADLVNIPEKIERWQNVYMRDGRYYNTGALYTTFEEATNRADMYTVACIKVSFTEGEGIS